VGDWLCYVEKVGLLGCVEGFLGVKRGVLVLAWVATSSPCLCFTDPSVTVYRMDVSNVGAVSSECSFFHVSTKIPCADGILTGLSDRFLTIRKVL